MTLLGWEGSFNSPLQLFNKDFWQSLTDDQRAEIIKLAARAHAKAQIDFNSSNQKALDTTASKGHPVVEPNESIQNAVQEWIDNGLGDSVCGCGPGQVAYSRIGDEINNGRGDALTGSISDDRG